MTCIKMGSDESDSVNVTFHHLWGTKSQDTVHIHVLQKKSHKVIQRLVGVGVGLPAFFCSFFLLFFSSSFFNWLLSLVCQIPAQTPSSGLRHPSSESDARSVTLVKGTLSTRDGRQKEFSFLGIPRKRQFLLDFFPCAVRRYPGQVKKLIT